MKGHAEQSLQQSDKTGHHATGKASSPRTLPLNVVPIVPQLEERASKQVARSKYIAEPF